MKFLEIAIKHNNINFVYFTSKNNVSAENICFFIHGLGDTCDSFYEVATFLEDKGYFVILFDLPGCGVNKELTINFDECIEVINSIFSYKNCNGKAFFFGHSLGGLITLFILAKYKHTRHYKIITIEPSLTTPDLNFFSSVKAPPDGIGHEGLLQFLQNANPSGYLKKYISNLSETNVTMFNVYVSAVNARFEKIKDTIFSSEIKFLYCYGENSIGADERKKLNEYPNIEVICFKNAEHWVHQDAKDDFLNITLKYLNT